MHLDNAAIANIEKIVGFGRHIAPCCLEIVIGSNRRTVEYIAVDTVGKHETIQVLRNLMDGEMPFTIAADDEHKILIPLESALHPHADKAARDSYDQHFNA